MFLSNKILIYINKDAILQVNSMSNIKKIGEELKYHIKRNKKIRLQHSQFSSNYPCLAEIAVDKTGVSKFINTLVVFIKQE